MRSNKVSAAQQPNQFHPEDNPDNPQEGPREPPHPALISQKWNNLNEAAFGAAGRETPSPHSSHREKPGGSLDSAYSDAARPAERELSQHQGPAFLGDEEDEEEEENDCEKQAQRNKQAQRGGGKAAGVQAKSRWRQGTSAVRAANRFEKAKKVGILRHMHVMQARKTEKRAETCRPHRGRPAQGVRVTSGERGMPLLSEASAGLTTMTGSGTGGKEPLLKAQPVPFDHCLGA